MGVSDLRCDRCAVLLTGPATEGEPSERAGVRFSYHPGDPNLRDDSGLLCGSCWADVAEWLGPPQPRACSVCGRELSRHGSLHLRRTDIPGAWQLCPPHAADFLNSLRTVEPKFDRDAFRLPLDESAR